MKVVKFVDGTYGVRKFSWGNLCYLYLDFETMCPIWWPRESGYFNDCKTTKEEAEDRVDKGTPI